MESGILPSKIGLLGLGLIAGSLARALKASEWSGSIAAWDCNPQALESGLALGVIDSAATDADALAADSDLLVIGAPPAATASLLPGLLLQLSNISSPPVVTDLASIKGQISLAASGEFPFFVPGHPIAGSENSGVAASRADLFAGREVILTPREDTSSDAVAMVEAMWRLTGAWITRMSLAEHDAALAASSHSPHMIAYALTRALGENPLEPMQHGGGALRDMTRIAGSDPVMWRDVALTNREALLEALEQFSRSLDKLRSLIDASDAAGLESYFIACRQLRRAHDLILNPLTPNQLPKEDAGR